MTMGKRDRKKYSCDFETTTDPNDCRVWAWIYMEIGNKKNYRIGTSINDFMLWVEKCQADLYFHNLKFDGSFIVNWLLHNGFEHDDSGKERTFNTIISNFGQWYMIDICFGYEKNKKIHTVIYDSLKKLPFPVKKIAKDFKLPIAKGEIDYHKPRPIGYELDKQEIEYIINDAEIIADALEIQFNQGMDKMTNGSDSLNQFKAMLSRKNFEKFYPSLSLELDSELRIAYKGGFTWLNERYRNKIIENGLVFDVNSLYPSVMYNRELPYGLPIYFKGKYEDDPNYPLFIQHIKCDFEIKEGYIPCIQVKYLPMMFKENEYIKDTDGEIIDLYLTNVDLEMFMEHYHVYNLEYIDGWKFAQKKGVFKRFIDKFMYIKTHSDGAIKQLAKLMLNSLYGKFGTNPKVTGKVPYLKEGSGANGFSLPKDEEGKVIDEYKDPVYLPMGIFITSYARHITISTAQKCYDRIIYCDTDSIHLEGLDIPEAIEDIIDDDKLGYWAHESTFKRAKYLRQKTYIQEIYAKEIEKNGERIKVPCSPDEATTTKTSVKCAGMTESIKKKVTFETFKVGFKADGKLMPKQVKGGVVLVDTTFEIK